MANHKKNIDNILREALLSEARVLPEIDQIASCPSIYKGVNTSDVASYVENGFQHQLAGAGGTAVGEGIYARLELQGVIDNLRYYGPGIIQGKVLGGFQNYIMYDAHLFPSIRHQVEKYYGSNISPEEQIRRIVTNTNDANRLIESGRSMNRYGTTAKLCRKYGIRGLMYEWDGCATVLPFDFSSVVVWAVTENGYRDNLRRVFDETMRKRFEKNFDWDFQLYGRYEWYDRNQIVRVETNNEMYALVRQNGRYNFVELQTDIVTNPEPKEISDIWLDTPPRFPSMETGIFAFNYKGIEFHATVYLPADGTPSLWFPDNLSNMEDFYRPNLDDVTDWVDLSQETLDEVHDIIQNLQASQKEVSESLKKTFRKCLNEEITDKDENEFISKHRCYVYRATGESSIPSIFRGGQLRQFAGSNDGSWYGEGVYAVVNAWDVQYGKYDKDKHRAGVKMIVLGGFSRFLIFDLAWAKRVYGQNYTIKDQVYYLFPKEAADNLWDEMTGWMNKRIENCQDTLTPGYYGRTTGMLHVMFDRQYGNAERFKKLFSQYNIRGALYTGGNDGLSIVCWNFDEVIPYQYTTDSGTTWNNDLFDFEAAKERSFKNTDPVSKFRHLYDYVSDRLVSCDIGDVKLNVTAVKTKEGRWNIININDKRGRKLLPVDVDRQPSIALDGTFKIIYNGVTLKGSLLLPGDNSGGIWYPEEPERLDEHPDIYKTSDWAELTADNIKEIVEDLKSMQL